MSVMRVPLFAALTLAALVHIDPASALSIINRDDHDHKVTIIEGPRSAEHVLKPEVALENVCQKGCVVRLNDSEEDEYELEGNEVVSIEDGNLYYDTPEAPASPPPESGKAGDGKGSAPKK
jgi:hypothetical protein